MSAHHAATDVVAVGEAMGLLDPDADGPLEDAGRFTLRIAGAEANVLIALARLGHGTDLVSAVGPDPVGRLILRTLVEQGVGTSHVRLYDEAPTGVFFKERFSDGLRRVYYYREGSAASRLTPEDAALAEVAPPRFLVLSGISLGLGRPDGLAAVAREALDRFAGRTTVVFDANLRPGLWDGPAAGQDFAQIRTQVDILLAGREELATLLPGDVDMTARRLCDQGMRAVVVKDGARGAVLHEHDRTTVIEPFPVQRVVDPVGAGDAFAAGLVCGLLRDWSLLDSARLGAMLGASVVTASGDWEAVPADEDPAALLARYESTLGLLEGRR
jgi:2-dehydro-3-deoxygluconokinase